MTKSQLPRSLPLLALCILLFACETLEKAPESGSPCPPCSLSATCPVPPAPPVPVKPLPKSNSEDEILTLDEVAAYLKDHW